MDSALASAPRSRFCRFLSKEMLSDPPSNFCNFFFFLNLVFLRYPTPPPKNAIQGAIQGAIQPPLQNAIQPPLQCAIRPPIQVVALLETSPSAPAAVFPDRASRSRKLRKRPDPDLAGCRLGTCVFVTVECISKTRFKNIEFQARAQSRSRRFPARGAKSSPGGSEKGQILIWAVASYENTFL